MRSNPWHICCISLCGPSISLINTFNHHTPPQKNIYIYRQTSKQSISNSNETEGKYNLFQFSAACWYFAESLTYRLQAEVDAGRAEPSSIVPLGLISTAIGGSMIEVRVCYLHVNDELTVFWMTDWLIADVCNFQRNGQQTPRLLPVLKRTPALTTKCSGTKKWFRIWTWRWKVRHNINSCPRSRGLPSLFFSLFSTLSVFLLLFMKNKHPRLSFDVCSLFVVALCWLACKLTTPPLYSHTRARIHPSACSQ